MAGIAAPQPLSAFARQSSHLNSDMHLGNVYCNCGTDKRGAHNTRGQLATRMLADQSHIISRRSASGLIINADSFMEGCEHWFCECRWQR
ncbi:hypothetical protein IG631_02813 [Alternaria alternata]|nr:hypothetical protein IG631_02813 [Alternaria alternata]